MSAFFIRDAHDGDTNHVLSSWLGGSKPRHTSWEVHHNYQREIILRLLSRGAKVRVAVNSEDSNHILSWVCYELFDDIPVIHWIYTKSIYRKSGLAKALLQDIGVDLKEEIMASTSSWVCDKLADKYKVFVMPHVLTYDKEGN